jgi:ribonuclease G
MWAKDGEGFIFRTGSSGCAEKLLADEIEKLRRQYYRLLKRARTATAPSLLSEPLDIVQQLANPYLQREFDTCLVNDEYTYQQVREKVQEPEKRNRIHLHQDRTPLIDTTLRDELTKAMQRKVWLKSGAYLLIDELDTLTVIDVNTGRFTGKNDVQETLWQTNRDAAREAARQIRLRNIGGIILIDFIDMLDEENAKDVVRVLEEAFTEDMNQTNIKGLTALGLMELTRHKMRLSLRDVTSEICPTCGGRGTLTARQPWQL